MISCVSFNQKGALHCSTKTDSPKATLYSDVGKQVGEVLHAGSLRQCELYTHENDEFLLTGSDNNSVRLW